MRFSGNEDDDAGAGMGALVDVGSVMDAVMLADLAGDEGCGSRTDSMASSLRLFCFSFASASSSATDALRFREGVGVGREGAKAV